MRSRLTSLRPDYALRASSRSRRSASRERGQGYGGPPELQRRRKRDSSRSRAKAEAGHYYGEPKTALIDELTGQQGEDRIAAAQLIDAGRVLVARKLVPEHPTPQPADFVFVEVADEVAHQARLGMRRRLNAVMPEVLEDVGTVMKRAFR